MNITELDRRKGTFRLIDRVLEIHRGELLVLNFRSFDFG
jgi:hypothetical protein